MSNSGEWIKYKGSWEDFARDFPEIAKFYEVPATKPARDGAAMSVSFYYKQLLGGGKKVCGMEIERKGRKAK